MGDREPVGLVPQPLEQVETLAGPGQDHRLLDVGQPHLLQPLGQPAQGDVGDAQLVQRLGRRGDLGRTAVDHHQDGRVRELARRPGRPGRPATGPSAPVAASSRHGRSSISRRNRRVITSCMAATSFWPSTLRMTNRRYSLLRGRPSSNTTIEATTSVPCRLEMSKHSIRSGAVGSSSASWISSSARLRVDRSPARVVLCLIRVSLGVPADGLHQGPLVAALRHPDVDVRTRAARSASGSATRARRAAPGPGSPAARRPGRWCRGRSRRTAGAGTARSARRCRTSSNRSATQPRCAPDPAAADVEDLHGHLERVLGQRDHVGVGAVAEAPRRSAPWPAAGRRCRLAAGRPARTPGRRWPPASPAPAA